METVRASWPGATRENPNGIPQRVRIAIVGEAPGDEEWWMKRPFVGASGQELRAQLRAAGINADDCLLTNVLDVQPKDNVLQSVCLRKEDLPSDYPIHIGPISTEGGNLYLRPDLLYNGARLRDEMAIAQPHVVIALGATACWAMLGSTSVGSLRGTVHRSVTTVPRKVVPTWHPAAVLRQWRMRPVAIADLTKARIESASPDITYDNAEVWLRPTLTDLADFERQYMLPGGVHSWDVETMRGEITCIGVAPDRERAIVVPFRTDPVRIGKGDTAYWTMSRNYWPTQADEFNAWRWVKRQLERNDTEKLGQNHLYDIQYEQLYGIRIRRFTRDTMLKHHSIYSEMKKDLGFLGSVYTNFPNWKVLGARHATEEKRDD